MSENKMSVSEVLAVLDEAHEYICDDPVADNSLTKRFMRARAAVAELASEVERLNDAVEYSERAFNTLRDELTTERDALRRRMEELERERLILIGSKEVHIVPPAMPESEMISYLQKRIRELTVEMHRIQQRQIAGRLGERHEHQG